MPCFYWGNHGFLCFILNIIEIFWVMFFQFYTKRVRMLKWCDPKNQNNRVGKIKRINKMKKTILKTLFAILFFVVNQNVEAQTADLDTKLWLRSSPTSGGPNLTVTTASSTYKVYIRVEAREISGKHGSFSLNYQRRQIAPSTSSWSSFTPTHVSSSPVFGSTYSSTRYVYQNTGTKYQYRVRVTFNPTTAGIPNRTEYTPIRTANIIGKPTACFSMYNVKYSVSENSKYGKKPVNRICKYTAAINGSCSKYESGYHVRLAEFNLATWSFVGPDIYSGWVGTGVVPSYISLDGLASLSGTTLTTGKLYIVILSVGPVWDAATPQFFRIINCKTSGETTVEEVEEVIIDETEVNVELSENENAIKLKLYPNPTEDYFKVSMNDSDLEQGALISVINSKGVEMYNGMVETNDFEVNTSEWRTGLYFCKIQIGDRIETKKIIKK